MRAAAVVLVFLLAGCGDKSQVNDEPVQEAEVALLQGAVVDASITPIANARLEVSGLEGNFSSDEGGLFRIEVDPGTYLVTAHKAGFQAAQVEAVANAKVTITMVRNLTITPFVEATTWEGFIACSARVGTADLGQTIGVNACNGVADQDVEHMHEFPTGAPQWFQTELVWESTQVVGDELSLTAGVPDCLDTSEKLRADGPSPQMYFMDSWVVSAYSLDEGTNACSRVFAFTSGTAADVAGAQVQQRFATFSHSFYHTEPAPGWMFSIDGAP